MTPPGTLTMVDTKRNKEEENKRNEAVMEKLRNHSDASEDVKRVLKAYSVKVLHDTNLKNLAKRNDDALHAVAEFLGGKPLSETGQKTYRTRKGFTDWIIMVIEELFKQDCSACKTKYTLERPVQAVEAGHTTVKR